jgi:hypothetical protein
MDLSSDGHYFGRAGGDTLGVSLADTAYRGTAKHVCGKLQSSFAGKKGHDKIDLA